MAHKVKFSIPERELGHSDIEFKVTSSNKKLGTLKVSKGTVVWVVSDHTKGFKMGWKDFAELMQKNGTKET